MNTQCAVWVTSIYEKKKKKKDAQQETRKNKHPVHVNFIYKRHKDNFVKEMHSMNPSSVDMHCLCQTWIAKQFSM